MRLSPKQATNNPHYSGWLEKFSLGLNSEHASSHGPVILERMQERRQANCRLSLFRLILAVLFEIPVPGTTLGAGSAKRESSTRSKLLLSHRLKLKTGAHFLARCSKFALRRIWSRLFAQQTLHDRTHTFCHVRPTERQFERGLDKTDLRSAIIALAGKSDRVERLLADHLRHGVG